MITPEEAFEQYLDGAQRCTSEILSLSDDWLAYNLFEEFSTVACSYFHDDTLTKLVDAGLIDRKTMFLSQDIRKYWLQLETGFPLGDTLTEVVARIRSDPRWKQLFAMGDELLTLLNQKPRLTSGF